MIASSTACTELWMQSCQLFPFNQQHQHVQGAPFYPIHIVDFVKSILSNVTLGLIFQNPVVQITGAHLQTIASVEITVPSLWWQLNLYFLLVKCLMLRCTLEVTISCSLLLTCIVQTPLVLDSLLVVIIPSHPANR